MTSIPRTATDLHDHSDHRERESVGLIGWQRSVWSSVVMAAVIAIAAQLVFTTLGVAIGITAADSSGVRAGNLGAAAGTWWLITGTISLLLGGLTLGRVSGVPRGTDLILAAIALWAVTALFGFFVVWSGIMSAATSPLAGMSGSEIDSMTRNQQSLAGSEFATGGATAGTPSAEQAQDAARTASWWAVIGMLIGAAVTIGGAWMVAPKTTVIVRN